jgi:hypothetical protein
MARARNIKPGFFQNEYLVELDFATRLCFIGLWTEADRDGKLEDRPKRLKMALFPGDNVDMDAMLNDLQSYGFIKRYSVGDKRLIRITKWHLHQSPHHTEKQSILPDETEAYTDNGALTVNSRKSDGENPPDSLIPDSLIQKKLSLNAHDQNSPPADNSGTQSANSGQQPSVDNSHNPADNSCTGEQLAFDAQYLKLARATGISADHSDADIRAIFDLFRCYKANANTLKTTSEWLGAWRTWCQREKVNYAKSNQKTGTGYAGRKPENNVQRALRVAQQAAERLAATGNDNCGLAPD